MGIILQWSAMDDGDQSSARPMSRRRLTIVRLEWYEEDIDCAWDDRYDLDVEPSVLPCTPDEPGVVGTPDMRALRAVSGTARIASGLLPGTVILTAATEEEANTIFVEQYMRQRVRQLYE